MIRGREEQRLGHVLWLAVLKAIRHTHDEYFIVIGRVDVLNLYGPSPHVFESFSNINKDSSFQNFELWSFYTIFFFAWKLRMVIHTPIFNINTLLECYIFMACTTNRKRKASKERQIHYTYYKTISQKNQLWNEIYVYRERATRKRELYSESKRIKNCSPDL